MHPALYLAPGDRLALAELASARLDGAVFEVGEGYMPADTVETPAARALSLCALVPKGSALSGPSAAWVHGAGDRPPIRHHVRRVDAAASRFRSSARLVVHDSPLRPGESQLVGGVAVVTVEATAVELALGVFRDDEYGRWLRALTAVFPGQTVRAHEAIAARGRTPGKRAALDLLRRLRSEVRTM